MARKPQETTSGDAPRRRGRPPSIDTDALLQVAREVFLARGIQATTLEVAERAGVSEGAIFHRFKTKEAFFREAMHLTEDDMPKLLLSAVEKLEGLELREALLQLATALLEIGKIGIPLMMMSWSNPRACAVLSYDHNKAKYRQVIKRLALFFEVQMHGQKLRNMDSEIIARAFLGSIHHYCMTRILAGDDEVGVIPEKMFARGLVDLLLNGALLPQSDLARSNNDA